MQKSNCLQKSKRVIDISFISVIKAKVGRHRGCALRGDGIYGIFY